MLTHRRQIWKRTPWAIEAQVSLATVSHLKVRQRLPIKRFLHPSNQCSQLVSLCKVLSPFYKFHKVNFCRHSQSQHAANCPRLASPGWSNNHVHWKLQAQIEIWKVLTTTERLKLTQRREFWNHWEAASSSNSDFKENRRKIQVAAGNDVSPAPRFLDQFSTGHTFLYFCSYLILFLYFSAHIPICPVRLDRGIDHHHDVGFMMEDGNMRGAAPECAGLGWVYYNGHCYLFDRWDFSTLVFPSQVFDWNKN